MKKTIIIIIIITAAAGVTWFFAKESTKPGKLNDFSQCLKAKGAVFYGAFWCPHCQNQKAMFGKSVKYLPYVECSTPDGKGMLAFCQEKGVKGYPTWMFPDGSILEGEIPLETLAEKTACQLPQ